MKCREAQELLAEVASGELDTERGDAVRAHAAGCAACATELEQLRLTIGLCRHASAEPLPDGFQLKLHQRLVAAGPPAEAAPFWPARLWSALAARPLALAGSAAGLAAVLAAALAVVGTSSLLRRQRAGRAEPVAYQVPESKVALVKIDFVADKPIDDVAFEITLPDGLRFVSGGQQLAERTFRFAGRLNAGSNPIPIAVKGPRAGRYKVIAHAIGDHLDVTQEVILEVKT
jgi:hypothetical protein